MNLHGFSEEEGNNLLGYSNWFLSALNEKAALVVLREETSLDRNTSVDETKSPSLLVLLKLGLSNEEDVLVGLLVHL